MEKEIYQRAHEARVRVSGGRTAVDYALALGAVVVALLVTWQALGDGMVGLLR